MEQLSSLFQEFIMKAIVMTENILSEAVDENGLDSFTSNRERLFQVIDSISQQIDWNQIKLETRSELSRQIDYIKKLDEKLLVKLQEHQLEVKKDLEKTHRQGESLKGYNLNDVK